LFALVGFVALLGCGLLHPRTIWAFAYPVYGASLLMLVAVLVLGHGSNDYGAQRWIEVAGVALQPSEVVKLTLIVVLARVLANPAMRPHPLWWSAGLTMLPILLIYLQPDLGTALSLAAIWFGMVVLAGTPRRYVAAIVGLGVVAAPIVWFGLKDYMRERVTIYLDPQSDPLGQGYNILQAQISIGSGGMFGKGLFEGSQTQLRYLRVSHSDFIFSVLGEELGFIGAVLLFAILLVLLFRVLRAFDAAEDQFSALLCGGVACMVAFQALANLGANVGLTPVVGIPLPFVSYGGSALVSHLAALGLVQATLLRRRRYRFEV
jgi:rod shape determining protein RodA